jgi:hypothetical protein
MTEPFETVEYKGYTIELYNDEDPENPREGNNLGTMVCWHRDYILGDEQPRDDPAAWRQRLAEEHDHEGALRYWAGYMDDRLYAGGYDRLAHYAERMYAQAVERILDREVPIMLPLYLFDHSGLSISTDCTMFRAFDTQGWDWGQVGWIYVTRADVLKEWGAKRMSKKLLEKATATLAQEVETYDKYLRGEYVGWVVRDESGAERGSCWGFDDEDYALEEAKRVVERMVKEVA